MERYLSYEPLDGTLSGSCSLACYLMVVPETPRVVVKALCGLMSLPYNVGASCNLPPAAASPCEKLGVLHMDIMPGPVGGAGVTPDARVALLLSVPCAGIREGRQPTLWCDAGRDGRAQVTGTRGRNPK